MEHSMREMQKAKQADKDNDEEISFDEFSEIMKNMVDL